MTGLICEKCHEPYDREDDDEPDARVVWGVCNEYAEDPLFVEWNEHAVGEDDAS